MSKKFRVHKNCDPYRIPRPWRVTNPEGIIVRRAASQSEAMAVAIMFANRRAYNADLADYRAEVAP